MKFCRPPPQLLSKRIKLCLEMQTIVFGSTPCPPPTSWWWRWATWSGGWAGSHSEAGCLMGLRSFHSLKRRENEITICFHRFKLIALNVASKHKLIFYTSIPIQNAQNHFSKSKTLQVMSNIGFEIEKEHILPRPLRIQRTWTLTCPSWPAACCGSGPAVWVVLLVVLSLFWNRSGACLPIHQKLWKHLQNNWGRLPFIKQLRSSSVYKTIEVVFHCIEIEVII